MTDKIIRPQPYDHEKYLREHGVYNDYTDPMQLRVALFHRAFGQPDLVRTPRALPEDRIQLRLSLIEEEGVSELRDAIDAYAAGTTDSPADMIDAIVDALYVSLGGLVEMGERVQGLPVEGSPSWPGLRLESVAVATSHAIETNLEELEKALVAGDREVSATLFSAIAQDCYQALLWAGIDPVPFFDEVQRANMSKLGADGRPIHSRGVELDGYPEGKVLKGPDYVAPDLARIYRELYTDEED